MPVLRTRSLGLLYLAAPLVLGAKVLFTAADRQRKDAGGRGVRINSVRASGEAELRGQGRLSVRLNSTKDLVFRRCWRILILEFEAPAKTNRAAASTKARESEEGR